MATEKRARKGIELCNVCSWGECEIENQKDKTGAMPCQPQNGFQACSSKMTEGIWTYFQTELLTTEYVFHRILKKCSNIT